MSTNQVTRKITAYQDGRLVTLPVTIDAYGKRTLCEGFEVTVTENVPGLRGWGAIDGPAYNIHAHGAAWIATVNCRQWNRLFHSAATIEAVRRSAYQSALDAASGGDATPTPTHYDDVLNMAWTQGLADGAAEREKRLDDQERSKR